MSIRYPQEITIKSQTEKALNRITRYQQQLDIVKKCLPIIEKYEGKKITKHIATAVSKEFPSARVWLGDQYGMFHLNVCLEGQSLNDKVSMLLGYKDSRENVVMEKILENNQCYLLNEERIPKLKAGIDKIPALLEKRNKAIALLQEVFEEADKYEMTYDFDVEK